MSADPAKPANLLGTRFEQVLRPIEEQLQLTLKTARAMTDHNLSVGEQVEAALRATLRRFVPGGFGVGHGKVYDAYGDSTNESSSPIPTTRSHFPMTTVGGTSSMGLPGWAR